MVRDLVRKVSWGSVWAAVWLLGMGMTFVYGVLLGAAAGSDIWGGLCR